MAHRRRRVPAYSTDLRHTDVEGDLHAALISNRRPQLGSTNLKGGLTHSLSDVNLRSESERSWLQSQPFNSSSPLQRQRDRGGFGVQSSPEIGLSEEAAAGAVRPNSGQRPSSGRLPAIRRSPKRFAAVQSLDPADQDFRELTAGVDLEVRVRWIPQVEYRGIMVKQLEHLVEFIEQRSNPKTRFVFGWFDPASGEQLCVHDISVCHLLHWVVEPLTRPVQCSYVEAVTICSEAQRPSWFVSHWWGDPLVEFSASVKKHAQTRYPDSCSVTGAYWVCAFAKNQHTDSASEFDVNFRDQPFYKALCECQGVLLVLDRATSTAFKRLWCCFELSFTVHSHLLLDIAAHDDQGSAQLVTDGVTNAESGLAEGEEVLSPRRVASGWARKAEREASFPVNVIRSGLSLEVCEAGIASDTDREKLLQVLAGASEIPIWGYDPSDPIWTEVDRRLRARIAIIALRQLIQQARSAKDVLNVGTDIRRALAEDPDQEILNMNLSSCWKMETTELIDSIVASEGIQSKVKRVNFNLGHCHQLTTVDSLLNTVAGMEKAQEIVLNFEGCTGLKSLEEFCAFSQNLKSTSSLKTLKLNFRDCHSLMPRGCRDELNELVNKLRRLNIPNLTVIAPDGEDLAADVKAKKVVAKAKPKPKPKRSWVSETAKAWAKRGSAVIRGK